MNEQMKNMENERYRNADLSLQEFCDMEQLYLDMEDRLGGHLCLSQWCFYR